MQNTACYIVKQNYKIFSTFFSKLSAFNLVKNKRHMHPWTRLIVFNCVKTTEVSLIISLRVPDENLLLFSRKHFICKSNVTFISFCFIIVKFSNICHRRIVWGKVVVNKDFCRVCGRNLCFTIKCSKYRISILTKHVNCFYWAVIWTAI